jgi:bifunctional UDP-N-acetylglucosamine pyrophosphorylase/glucosamine-1-phosphate N-acetyltransferase
MSKTEETMSLSVIILAAGQGTRMKSSLPKVLHRIAGTPMIEHVYNRSRELNANAIYIVHGYGGEQLKNACGHFKTTWVEQTEQLGTAHAVQQASPMISQDDAVLVLYGDVPLIKARTLEKLVAEIKGNDIALLSVVLDDPAGYGRIIRDSNNRVVAIVEDRDASAAQKKIKEVNTGILAVRAGYLNDCLKRIHNNNSQGEYYLTDLIALAVQDGNTVLTAQPDSSTEVEGVNDRNQLAKLERVLQRAYAEAIMADGVSIADPARIDIRGELNAGNDCFIDVNCVFEGEVNLGTGVTIGAGCVIKNSIIACSSVIKPFSVIEDAFIGKCVEVGPFARIRPGTHLAEGSRIGNFVEIKNTQMGKNSKASHLTYLGDSEIGANVNIGAGTITCNYDGANKHKTIIKDGVFIGSDTQLVAPVTIGENATIGAGSTITKDAEGNALTLSRASQKTVRSWVRPTKKK